MQYEEFIKRVIEEGNINDRAEAEGIIQVTLETLGERLYRTERASLGAQLPGELKNYLNLREEPGPTRRHVDRFTGEEFYNRVSARAEIALPEARRQTRAVLGVLTEAVSPAVVDEALSELSDDFKKLFGR